MWSANTALCTFVLIPYCHFLIWPHYSIWWPFIIWSIFRKSVFYIWHGPCIFVASSGLLWRSWNGVGSVTTWIIFGLLYPWPFDMPPISQMAQIYILTLEFSTLKNSKHVSRFYWFAMGLFNVWKVNLFYDRHGANAEAATLQVLPSLFIQTAFSLAHWFVTLFWFHFRMSPFVNLNFKLFWIKSTGVFMIL